MSRLGGGLLALMGLPVAHYGAHELRLFLQGVARQTCWSRARDDCGDRKVEWFIAIGPVRLVALVTGGALLSRRRGRSSRGTDRV